MFYTSSESVSCENNATVMMHPDPWMFRSLLDELRNLTNATLSDDFQITVNSSSYEYFYYVQEPFAYTWGYYSDETNSNDTNATDYLTLHFTASNYSSDNETTAIDFENGWFKVFENGTCVEDNGYDFGYDFDYDYWSYMVNIFVNETDG